MPTRYDYRRIFYNQEPLYDNLFEERHVKGIRHYSTPTMRYPTTAEISRLTRKSHVWKTGDRFYKLAIENYGSAQYWWVIALFNRTPTEANVQMGDVIYIPLPLQEVLTILVD
jgi:hypothetical protein